MSTETIPGSDEVKEETSVPPADATHDVAAGAPLTPEGEDLTEVWQKMSQLNEELAQVIQERDHAVNEGVLLREQLRQADEALEKQGEPAQAQELSALTEERDQGRRDYAALREEFETLKQGQSPKEESGKYRKESELLIQELRQKLEERDREITALKTSSGSTGSADVGDDQLKREVASLREELARVKEDASNAQRGLVLSQKALQETRDTLREATEGTSLSRHNFDNLKNECATLVQQNTVLQAQNDELTRELGTAKAKSTGRL
jgi:chromosome segregation ATPase